VSEFDAAAAVILPLASARANPLLSTFSRREAYLARQRRDLAALRAREASPTDIRCFQALIARVEHVHVALSALAAAPVVPN